MFHSVLTLLEKQNLRRSYQNKAVCILYNALKLQVSGGQKANILQKTLKNVLIVHN